jgi:uncharacterized protein YkwD
MWRNAGFLGLVAGVITSLAGCPAPIVLDSSGGSGGPVSTTSGGGTQGSQTAVEDLTSEFPECQEPPLAATWRVRVLDLVNQERAREGLSALKRSAVLQAQADQYACEMIHYEFFAHVNPFTDSDLEDRADEFGYDWVMIGENLAAGQPTPDEAFESWMNSPDHRENILRPGFTELGVGVRTGGPYGIYWVQEFGQPMP